MKVYLLTLAIIITLAVSRLAYLDMESQYMQEVSIWKDKYNREHFKVLNYSPHDTIYKTIIKTIKGKPENIVHYRTITRIDTVVQVKRDTILLDLKQWGKISVKQAAINDSVKQAKIDLSLVNDYSVVFGFQKLGLFKKIPFAEVINDNPYTSTVSAKTYKVKGIKIPKLFFSINAGYGVTHELKPTPYIGIGVSFNILSIY